MHEQIHFFTNWLYFSVFMMFFYAKKNIENKCFAHIFIYNIDNQTFIMEKLRQVISKYISKIFQLIKVQHRVATVGD